MFVATWMGKKGKPVRRVVKAANLKEANLWAVRQEMELGLTVRIVEEKE